MKENHNKTYTQNPQYGILFGSMTAMVVCQQGILHIKFTPLLKRSLLTKFQVTVSSLQPHLLCIQNEIQN